MQKTPTSKHIRLWRIVVLFLCSFSLFAQTNFSEYRGKVVDDKSNKALEYVNLNVVGSNISTVTNSEGEFLLKVPEAYTDSKLKLSLLGYYTIMLDISELDNDDIKIGLKQAVTNLDPVSLSTYTDAKALVRQVFENKGKTSSGEQAYMTAFYRETIKKRNRNVSLTEAVVNILKQPYYTPARDMVALNKARKQTDYKRLDTLSVKLQGGPFSTLFMDIIKYPEYLFTDEVIDAYTFTFDEPTVINNKNVYVVNFRALDDRFNYNYYGKLFIDMQSIALVSASYDLDVSNAKKSKNMLVRKKPRNVEVYPLQANYRVNYTENQGKWYFNYSNLNLRFKVNKKREWFNKVYTLSSEMAVTDFQPNTKEKRIAPKERLKPNVVLADAITGFADPDFWGEYNLIEPDKSIESAIKKIKRNLK